MLKTIEQFHLREARPDDAEACGRVICNAFQAVQEAHGYEGDSHGFPAGFLDPAFTPSMVRSFLERPDMYSVVAQDKSGRVVGSNFLTESDAIAGVGPITVDPLLQGGGVGRSLMRAVLDRGQGRKGIRLVQDAFNASSMSLYASLGFEVREPLVLMLGSPKAPIDRAVKVRPMTEADLDACTALCRAVHGITRTNELRGALQTLAPLVAERGGRITAYMTSPGFWIANHAVAETEEDLKALILGAAAAGGMLSFLLPTRQASLFRWCLDAGLRTLKPLTLMAMGEYHEPKGAWLPSVLY
jgi:predicted N-acetyltransferase YhbS